MKKVFRFKQFMVITIMVITSGMTAYAQSIIPQKDEKKGQWGYVSKSTGKWVVKPKFDEASELTQAPNGQLRGTVSLKGKKGFVDDSGKILGAGVAFEEVTPMQGDAVFVKVKGKTGVSDYSGVYKVKPEVENVEQLGDEGWIMTVKGKKGILKNDGIWLIEPIYNDINTLITDFFIVDKGGKAGILSRKGEVMMLPGDFTKVEPYENLWKVYKNDKTGLYDLSNKTLLVKPEFSDVKSPINTTKGILYPFANNGKWGFLNAEGKVVVKPKYSSFLTLNNPSSIVLSESTSPNYIYFPGNKKEQKLRDFKEGKAYIFNKVSLVYDQGGMERNVEIVFFPDGQAVDSPIISRVGNLYKVIANNECFIFDSNGKKIYTCPSSDIFGFSNVGKFYEIEGKGYFSILNSLGDVVYHQDSTLNDFDKYRKFSNRAKEDKDWQVYVDGIKKSIIKKVSWNLSSVKKLYNSKDEIGEDLYQAIMESCPKDKRFSLMEEALNDDGNLGSYLMSFFGTDELTSEEQTKLLKISQEKGLLKDFVVDDFECNILNMGDVAVTYVGNKPNVVFPSTVIDENGKEYKVTKINGAKNKNTIVSIEVPSSVNLIGEEAFANCAKLTTVKVPENIKLQYRAFDECPNLNYFNNNYFILRNLSESIDVLKKYLAFTSGCPKILSQIEKNIDAVCEDKDVLVQYSYEHWIDHNPGYHGGILGNYEEVKKLGANIIRTYAAKGNVKAMIYLCDSFLDSDKNGSFKDSEFVTYAKRLIAKKPAYGYFYMGRAYEHGIGVTPSRSSAHSYYAKGRELGDRDCDNGYWRTF